ncbi:MAG TPA: DUF3037 domain-containing protein [Kofleriaceae bacterium]|nr:DUF3037 domain-containing protein [Kofleriaceae bacterium]
MAEASPYAYALVRIVPVIEREEFVNAGVILFARTRDFLGCALHLDEPLVRALAPDADLPWLARHLEAFRAVCEGDPAAGPVARLPAHERFHWLTAPRSTIIQPGPVHAGVAVSPAAALAELFAARVRRPATAAT